MKIAKELAKEAKRKGICEPWYKELITLDDKRAMVAMYVRGIDFCLSNNFPSNDYIRANFKGIMEDYGVFLDEEINITNCKRCVALGSTHGQIEIGSYGVCEIFAKNDSILTLTAKDNAFVMVDIFENATINVVALGNAKVCVNVYNGGRYSTRIYDNSRIKIVRKNKKSY